LFSPDFECEQLQHNLDSFLAHGAKDGGPIAQFDIPSFSLVDCIAVRQFKPHDHIRDFVMI
jgi:hypothetical protein